MRTRLLFILLTLLLACTIPAMAQTEQKDSALIRISLADSESVIDIDFRGSGEVRHSKKEAPRLQRMPRSVEGTPVVAIRTNLLLPLMNLGVEVPVSNRFSLGAGWSYPWLMRSSLDAVLPPRQFCAQTLAGSLEGRWWLGGEHTEEADTRGRLRGHSIGAVLSGGYYDWEYDGRGQQGEFAAIGVDYLYSLPLGHGGIHLEFNAGIGIALDWNRSYTVPYEGGFLIADSDKKMQVRPVPIRVAVCLCVPIMKKEKGHE